jgi:hypothetical protein
MLHSDHHVYAIDALNSEKPSDKSAAPDFPGENPSHDAIVRKLTTQQARLVGGGMVNQTSICELHHAKVHSFTNLHDFFQGSKVMLVMRTGASKHM